MAFQGQSCFQIYHWHWDYLGAIDWIANDCPRWLGTIFPIESGERSCSTVAAKCSQLDGNVQLSLVSYEGMAAQEDIRLWSRLANWTRALILEDGPELPEPASSYFQRDERVKED
jgi:hypothetical protein